MLKLIKLNKLYGLHFKSDLEDLNFISHLFMDNSKIIKIYFKGKLNLNLMKKLNFLYEEAELFN